MIGDTTRETTSVRQQGGVGAGETTSVRQQGGGGAGETTSVRQQGGVGGESCCSTLVVTPMYHKGLLGWRYDCRSNYMVTLTVSPRTDILGNLREWGVERSAAVRAVYEAWQEIEARFQDVRATYQAIMPDHFHGMIFITREGAADLAEVVAYFAAVAERKAGRRLWAPEWRDSVCIARGQLDRQIQYVLNNAKKRWIKANNRDLFKRVMGVRHWRLARAAESLADFPDADSFDWVTGCGGPCRSALVVTGERVGETTSVRQQEGRRSVLL